MIEALGTRAVGGRRSDWIRVLLDGEIERDGTCQSCLFVFPLRLYIFKSSCSYVCIKLYKDKTASIGEQKTLNGRCMTHMVDMDVCWLPGISSGTGPRLCGREIAEREAGGRGVDFGDVIESIFRSQA